MEKVVFLGESRFNRGTNRFFDREFFMAPGRHDIPFTKSHTPLAPIGLLEKASFSRLSPLSMER